MVHQSSLAKARAAILDYFRKNPGGRIGSAAAKGFLGVSNSVADLILVHFQARENLLLEVNGLFMLRPERSEVRKDGERARPQGAKQE